MTDWNLAAKEVESGQPVTDWDAVANQTENVESGDSPVGYQHGTEGSRAAQARVNEGISNIPSSGVQLVKDMTYPIRHPINTAKAMKGLAVGGYHKFTPGIQPEEANVDAVKNALIDRYGSLDAIGNTLVEDPVGALADLSSVLTGGTTLLAKTTGTVGKIGRGLEPINMVRVPTSTAMRKAIPETLPARMYESAAKFRTKAGPAEREALIGTAFKEGLKPTAKGVIKARDIVNTINDKIDGLIKEASGTGATIPKGKLFRLLREARKDLGGPFIEGSKDLRQINQVAKNYDVHLKRIKKDTLTLEEVQKFKKDVYKRTYNLKRASAQGRAKPGKEVAMKAMARAAKEEIENMFPSVKKLNMREGEILELLDHLEKAAGRIENRDFTGIGIPMKATAGGVIGDELGAAMGITLGLVDTPKVKAAMGLMLNKYKTGTATTRQLPTLIRNLGVQTGRLGEQWEERNPQENEL